MNKYTIKDVYADVLKEAIYVPEKIRPYILQRICEIAYDPTGEWASGDAVAILTAAYEREIKMEDVRGLEVARRAKIVFLLVRDRVEVILKNI